MKKLIVGLLLLASMSVYAQETETIELTRPMKCAKTQDVINFLIENYGETMAWVGKDENNSSYLSIYKNKQTGTWTLIQYDSNIACFIGSGSQGTPV